MKRTSHRRRRPQIFRQGLGHVPQRISGTAGHDEIAFRQKRARLAPFRNVAEGVHSDQEKKSVRFFESLFQASNCIDRIIHTAGRRDSPGVPGTRGFRVTEWRCPRLSGGAQLRSRKFWRLQQRRYESPFVLCSKRHHGITMDERGERLFLFVRRNVRRHKQHLPQRVAAGGAWASARCPRWIGSKLPPNRPIFIPIFSA